MWAMTLQARNPACPWRLAAEDDAATAVKVHTFFPAGEGLVWEEADVSGPAWRELVERLRARPGVHEVDVLEASPERARIRVRIDACPLLQAVAASGVPPRFPFDVKDGRDRWLLVGAREDAVRFVEELARGGVEVQVASVREHRPHPSLTPRQRELMDAAIAQGYYEVPRRVTLTALARRLHLSKSTLSEALARGERHVLEDMRVAGTAGGP